MVEKKQKELLIIIPAYNEEKNIERVLEELERLFCPNGAEVEMCPHFRLNFSGNRGKITKLQRKTWKEDVYVHHC